MKGPPSHWTTLKKLIYLKAARGSSPSWVWQLLTGTAPLTLLDAVAHPIHSLTQYGLCVQDGTPTPDSPVDIVCNNGVVEVSPNLANMVADNIVVGKYISTQGVIMDSAQNFYYSPFVMVSPNTNYTLSISSAVYYVTISEYSAASDAGFIRRNSGATGGNTALTITTSANTQYIRFGSNINGGTGTLTLDEVLAIDWMLTQSATAQDYRPYGEIYTDGAPEVLTVSADGAETQTVSVPMLLSVGDYADEAELISGIKTGRVGVKVFDGSESFTASSSGAMITAIPDVAIGAENTPMNTHFALESSATSIAVGKQRFGANGTKIYSSNYYMKHTSITTVDDFKAYLAAQYAAGTPVIVLYPLATATTEQTTPHELHTSAGTNVVDVTAEVSPVQLSVEYAKQSA